MHRAPEQEWIYQRKRDRILTKKQLKRKRNEDKTLLPVFRANPKPLHREHSRLNC